MTERGQPTLDGSPACPFVAFDDDRDSRADRPDHRHRCFAEAEPAPRALAHQEAYCLSSAFPVCPTFQAWARREAAQARGDKGAAGASGAAAGGTAPGRATAAAGGATAAAAAGAEASADAPDVHATASPAGHDAEEWTPDSVHDDAVPIESQPRRNPPRDWAAPPPWATGGAAGSATGARSAGAPRTTPPAGAASEPPAPPPRTGEGQGLAGSAADRLANGESVADVMAPSGSSASAGARPPAAASSSRSADYPSAGPDPELAGLVGGAAVVGATAGANPRPPASISEAERAAASYPPPARSGRRPTVSSTRGASPSRDKAPQLEHVQHDGPAWEHARRYEAYPTIKTRAGFGGLPGLPRVAILAGALGVAALALFFLPALLGLGGGGGSSASPTPSASVVESASPSPTEEPAPTPQVYVIKQGDTLSKIAKRNGITLDQLLAANKDTIKNPDKISVGDEIIIPVPVPEEVTDASPEESIAP